MGAQSEFRTLLANGDVAALRAAWHRLAPHLPQPQNDEQAEIVMHHARTLTDSLSLRARAYSHRWLDERGLPSGLPDFLKAKAERMYPRIVEGVGISVNSSSALLRPATVEIRRAMEDAVSDAYANGDRDPELVRGRMVEARQRVYKALFGR